MWLFFFIFAYIESFLYIIIYKSIIMSVGNLKTYGGKGTNLPWQLNMLFGQESAANSLSAINVNTTNVDSLLNQILAAIQGGADYEAALVIDSNNVTWLEVRIYNPDTGTFNPPVYFQAGSNVPGTPVDPITYVNPNSYLAQMLIVLTDIDDKAGKIATRVDSKTRTPNFYRVSGAFTIAQTIYSISFSNVGSADATVLGAILKPGETINFDAGSLNNTYPVNTFDYDATGTELIIIFNS